jgi:hypothetical protein
MLTAIGNQQSAIGNLLYGRPAADLEDYGPDCFSERAVERASAGALVPSAAEALSDVGHVEFALAAEAYSVTAVGEFAKECGDFDSADGKDVVHQPFAILLQGGTSLHLFSSDPEIADVAFQV